MHHMSFGFSKPLKARSRRPLRFVVDLVVVASIRGA
jgi:hypothetical protein